MAGIDELTQHFADKASRQDKNVLYHCVNRTIEGDALMPTCKRTVNGREDVYLFAATHLSKSLAFAFDYNKDCPDIISNGAISGTDDEFAIICKRKTVLREMPRINVYAFNSEGFEEAWPGSNARQFVSRKPVPFDKTKLILTTDNVEDLMQGGLQIFSTEKTFSELGGRKFLKRSRGFAADEWLGQLLQSGDFQWENKERRLNPTPKLLKIQNDTERKHVFPFNPGGVS